MLHVSVCDNPAAVFVCQDSDKRTPLHAAAYLGDAEIIELLILSGKHVIC